METLPTLDAHAHIDPARTADELAETGAVLAMTTSLDEAALVVDRREPYVAWGVGCHPRRAEAQEAVATDATRPLCSDGFSRFILPITQSPRREQAIPQGPFVVTAFSRLPAR